VRIPITSVDNALRLLRPIDDRRSTDYDRLCSVIGLRVVEKSDERTMTAVLDGSFALVRPATDGSPPRDQDQAGTPPT
jgi:hypothetical protein